MILILSSSLHPTSRSRILANEAKRLLDQKQTENVLFDLAESPLPFCDGESAYGDENVQRLSHLVEQSIGILIAAPIYNYDVNAAAKNAFELTGRNWTGKTVGMMFAAGAQGSYMSPMGIANSLMLDFRCLIVPRFVYATGDAFEANSVGDETVQERLAELVNETTRIALAVSNG